MVKYIVYSLFLTGIVITHFEYIIIFIDFNCNNPNLILTM